MKSKITLFMFLGFWLAFLMVSCSDDDDNNNVGPSAEEFVSISSPYLVCANRNPGGVGFDFYYDGKKGGANNMDSLSVSDFSADVVVKTIKAEKPDGTLAGMPYFKLSDGVQAINYSAIDTTCKGIDKFKELDASILNALTFSSDDEGFNVSDLITGETGKPLQTELVKEFNKLIIGMKWKTSANNIAEGDEIIWLIKTNDGKTVKMIITDFPADPAPTSTGYIALEWELLD